MPRVKGFMGFGDDRTDDDAFDEGRRESRKANIGDDIGRGLNQIRENFVKDIFGDGRSSQEKAYDAGWEKGEKERGSYDDSGSGKRREKAYSGSRGSSSTGRNGLGGLIILVAAIGLCYYAYVEGERIGNEWTNSPRNSGSVRSQFGTSTHRFYVETKNNSGLHLRSQKSLNSSSVVFAPEGSEVEILYFDEQQDRINGRQGRWCRARYDGKEGWAWGWYLIER